MGDYLRSELLNRVSRAEVSLLTRTSVLDRMCGPLCDAIMNIRGADRILEELMKENAEQGQAWADDPDGFFRSLFGPAADTLPTYWLAMMASAFGGPVDTD